LHTRCLFFFALVFEVGDIDATLFGESIGVKGSEE